MQHGTVIYTRGYRGPDTKMIYMPPGEYTVGEVFSIAARTVTPAIARNMVEIELATVVSVSESGVSNETPAPEIETSTITNITWDVADVAVVEGSDRVDEVAAPADSAPDGNYEDMTLDDLRALASARGISYSGLRKADLIDALVEDDTANA